MPMRKKRAKLENIKGKQVHFTEPNSTITNCSREEKNDYGSAYAPFLLSVKDKVRELHKKVARREGPHQMSLH